MNKLFLNKRPFFLLLTMGLILPLASQAELFFEKETLNLKAEVSAKQAFASFKFTNSGAYPVEITNVKTSCGCTTAKLAKTVYSPGESGSIEATFNIGNRKGSHSKRITLSTDDPQKGRYNLILKVDIPRLLEIKPRMLYWRKDEKLKPKTLTINVTREQPITITDVVNKNPAFSVELKEIEAGRRYEVIALPDADMHAQRTTLHIVTDLPAENKQQYFAYLGVQ